MLSCANKKALTERRLDYLCKQYGTDPDITKSIYTLFRNEMGIFNVMSLTQVRFDFLLREYPEHCRKINSLLVKAGAVPIYTDPDDIIKSMKETAYYWSTYSEDMFSLQEAYARVGVSDFTALDSECLGSYMNTKINEFKNYTFNSDTLTFSAVNEGEKCKLYFPNGDYYEGEIADGSFNGYGEYVFGSMIALGENELHCWRGEWQNGKPWTGEGSYLWGEFDFFGVRVPEYFARNCKWEKGRIVSGRVVQYSADEIQGNACIKESFSDAGEVSVNTD